MPTVKPSENKQVQEHFEVAPSKITVMSLGTLGLYGIYWQFKQWSAVKHEQGSDIKPFWRSIFSVFYVYSLFRTLQIENAGVLAISAILLWYSWKLPGALFLISMLAFAPLIVAQKQMNNRSGHTKVLAKYSGKEIALVCIGGIFLILAIIGTFVHTR